MQLEILLAALFLASIGLGDSAQAQSGGEPVRIGAIVSLTGDAARNGLNWLEGAKLTLEDLNKSGFPCQLIIEDDSTLPVKVANAFTKLATVDKVAGIIGGTWDFLAEAAYPFAERYKVPFITPTNPVEALSSQAAKNPWIFTNGLSIAAVEQAARAFLKHHKKVNSLALVYINVPYGILHAGMLKTLADEFKLVLAAEQIIDYQGFADLIKLAALRIKERKAELVFAVLNYEGIDLLLRELEKLRVTPYVLMTHTLKEAYDFAKAPERYKQAFGIFQDFSDPSFEQRFVAKFGHDPYGYAASGYDATQFLVRALTAGVSSASAAQHFEYQGITGKHILPAPTRELVTTRAQIMAIREGRLEKALPF